MSRTLFAAVLGCAMAAFGQGGDALPSVDDVLNKYVQALGGKAALEKLNSRLTKGMFEVPAFGAGGKYEELAAAPNKVMRTIDIDGYGIVRQNYDGAEAYSEEPQGGKVKLEGDRLAQFLRDADFHADLKMKELIPGLAVTGKAKAGDKDAILLTGKRVDGGEDKLYFDAATGLLIRRAFSQTGPDGNKADVVLSYDEYKEQDGVKFPYLVKYEDQNIAWHVKVSSVQNNVPVQDAQFKAPAQ